MKRKMVIDLIEQEVGDDWPVREVSDEDIEALALLMKEAYRGSIDNPEDDSLEAARAEARGTIDGKYGSFLYDASLVIELDGVIVSACMISFYAPKRMPMLCFSMTHPDLKNRGMAGYLLRKAMNRLIDMGFEQMYLHVTVGNVPAERLYERMGFRPM